MKIALQLYSIRDVFYGDIEKCMSEVAEIGYDGVELGDFGGVGMQKIVSAMWINGLEVFSIHTGIEDIIKCDAEKLEYYASLGCRYMPISSLPSECMPGGGRYSETLIALKKFSETAQKFGIKLLYHNHDFDLERVGNSYKLDILLSDMPSELLGAELDTCWIYSAGLDVLEYYKKYSARCPILHVKDCVAEGGRNGFRELGGGVIDFAPILDEAKRSATEWLCVEQDEPSPGKTSMECAKLSFDFLKKLVKR